ncbi:hypothetical protein Sjap_004936 [Stephania japonica]|uniref:Carbohydrate kinase PfkB domain-containing protein n=1 Tax=Stephania japonica TaxID=461633 RepID=A0AAP0K359_9MAGN
MKEFCDIQSQIIQVHEALHGSVVDEHIVDDKDLTTKRLRELKLVRQGLQSKNAARSAGVPVILDVGGMDGLIPVDLLTNVDIFSPNETELERLTGMPTESFEQISQSVAKIHEMVYHYILPLEINIDLIILPFSMKLVWMELLGERFYFGDHVLPCFETGIPLLKRRLHQLPDAENISIAFPDDGDSIFPMLEKRDGTPKDQLSSIKQTLKELQRKREERMKEFFDIQSQIIQVHEALRGSVVDGQIAARSAGVPVILDAGGMDGLIPVDLLTNVDYFSPNETELERLMRMPTESFEQICQSVAKIHEMGVKEVLVKLGSKFKNILPGILCSCSSFFASNDKAICEVEDKADFDPFASKVQDDAEVE